MRPVRTTDDTKTPAAQETTLGHLLMSALSGESAREANRQMVERVTARSPIVGAATRAHVAAYESCDPWGHVPAALAIRAYTNRLWGLDLTPEAVRRVRGHVCEMLDIDTGAADALPLSRVAELLRSGRDAEKTNATDDTMAAYRWLKVTQVAKLFALNPGQVSRNSDAGTFTTNGRTGSERRIDVLSVVKWVLERLDRQSAGDDPGDNG